MLPIAISVSPLIVAFAEVISSGRLVASATIVILIIFSLTPKLQAIFDAYFTTTSPPIFKEKIPKIIAKTGPKIDTLFESLNSNKLFFAVFMLYSINKNARKTKIPPSKCYFWRIY